MNNYYDYPYQKQFDSSKYPKAISQTPIDPHEGFIRGNLFANLYEPYTNVEPFQLTPKNDREALLNRVRELNFAIIELNLYLDIYNNDQEKLNLFNAYRTELIKVKREFERRYGPLTLSSDALSDITWNWVNEPWPWEVE